MKDISELPAYEDLLERIKLIRAETEVQHNTDALYTEHTISQEEIIPDFLKDEDIQTIEGSDELLDDMNN